jgi:hypothetical protein
MAFITIPAAAIEVGKALKKSLFTLIKDNFDDHETRIDGLEQGANKVEVFNFEVMGYINNYTAAELVQIGTFRAPSDTTLTEVKLILMNGTNGSSSSTSGVLSIDIQKSTDDGVTWNTILAAQPEIGDGTNTTGSESALVTFITNGEDVAVDDIIRVNVTSKKDTQGSFLIVVYGDVA